MEENELAEDWTRVVFKCFEWSNRKGVIGKVEPSKQFL